GGGVGRGFWVVICILACFRPMFFLVGFSRAFFPPLALAVGFSMIASYLLSSTVVPVLSVRLFRSRQERAREEGHGFFARVSDRYSRFLERAARFRRAAVPAAAL